MRYIYTAITCGSQAAFEALYDLADTQNNKYYNLAKKLNRSDIMDYITQDLQNRSDTDPYDTRLPYNRGYMSVTYYHKSGSY